MHNKKVVPAGLTQSQARSDNSREALRNGCHSKRDSNLEVVDGTYSTKVWQQRGVATKRCDNNEGQQERQQSEKMWMVVWHQQAKNCGCGSVRALYCMTSAATSAAPLSHPLLAVGGGRAILLNPVAGFMTVQNKWGKWSQHVQFRSARWHPATTWRG